MSELWKSRMKKGAALLLALALTAWAAAGLYGQIQRKALREQYQTQIRNQLRTCQADLETTLQDGTRWSILRYQALAYQQLEDGLKQLYRGEGFSGTGGQWDTVAQTLLGLFGTAFPQDEGPLTPAERDFLTGLKEANEGLLLQLSADGSCEENRAMSGSDFSAALEQYHAGLADLCRRCANQ